MFGQANRQLDCNLKNVASITIRRRAGSEKIRSGIIAQLKGVFELYILPFMVDITLLFFISAIVPHTNDCWAVGQDKTFVHFNGSSWASVTVDTSIPNRDIHAVRCQASNNCYATGLSDPQLLIAHYDGNIWSRQVTSVPSINRDLFSLAVIGRPTSLYTLDKHEIIY